ncbi:hypothetical protein CALVIDRAFT_122720 [Calocera viscosa TUFC12733]|uniref:Uncharacterized protein n=1 Tax=Calocera viscosa (strain TUFC12733) TaxID=1330018 RepID=A0A167RML7_CALVF|nr:hypothetical protein CALVIDRAFT_122720 [Calocera viscosa TUFC12733]
MLLCTYCSLVPSHASARTPSCDSLPLLAPTTSHPGPAHSALLTILMPFTLILALHVMGVSRKWPRRKLVPSAIACIMH